MVRNAVDHGIESPEERLAAGKPELGHVHLSASHQGGNIVIEIRDDGKGLDPEKLIAKAIERGVVQPGEELTDQETFALIFAPGFSMAKEVTDISGRGVGMDVVRRAVDQLRGRVEIYSEKGKGSTFAIRLPLTLAIIDGMIVRVNDERFIIPTISIEQSLRPLPEQITTVQRRGEVLNVRGQLIPLIQLGQLFGLSGRVNPSEAMVVIAICDGRPIGLVIDELIGQQQVVIKTLGERFKRLKGIAGAAILGDGKVGLILEMSGLVSANENHRTAAYERPEDKSEKTAQEAAAESIESSEALQRDDVARAEPELVTG
jgi:two-component system chemotaxis sensor kinase CheA